MVYKVYCDNNLLYHSNLESLKISNPTIELEVNKTGSFEFTIQSNHPYFNFIQKLKSIITVYQDGFLLFRGRVLDDEIGWYNERTITCEGDLAFLLDSIQRPYEFSGSIVEYLTMLVDSHNAQVDAEKQFILGNVTVTDPNDYIVRANSDYADTWSEINDKLIDLLGGYLIVRHEDEVHYLDYLSDFTTLSPQKITFGKNLLDLKRTRKGADIATVVIPLGAKLTDESGQDTATRLTIESVNDGVDYIEDETAVAQYGLIVKTVLFEDVTDPENLKTKGQAHLADSVNLMESIELSTADLATVDESFASFHLGTQVQVSSSPHGIEQYFTVNKLSVNLLEPAENKLTLGKTVKAFSEAMKDVSQGQGLILQTVEKSTQAVSEAVYNVEQNLLASIQVAAENIQSVVAENYYLKDETEALVSSVSTAVEQTNKSVEIQFDQFKADVESVAQNVDAEFETIHKYIRFEDGNIIQGAEDSPFQKIQSATKESYYDSGAEVAYFSNRKLYVTDGEYTHSLRIGNLEITPRSNGNTSINIVS